MPPPLVHHVVPPSGSASGGETRVIDGRGFTRLNVTAVSFGGKAATSFSVVDDAHIRAVAPAHPAGTVDVTVTTSAGVTSPIVRPQNSAVDDDEYTFFPPSPFAAAPNAGLGAGTFSQNQPPRPVPPGGLGAVPAPGGGFSQGAASGLLSPPGASPPALAAGPPLEASHTPGAAVHLNMTKARDDSGRSMGGALAGVGAGGLLVLCSCFGRRRPSDPELGHARARGRAQPQRA
ncbi:MAG: IPT/TIG domain-containing protein [Actinomycetota bacterium]|nr:IPT/TIG domain-containing protein [Actinomycetota bacterium]